MRPFRALHTAFRLWRVGLPIVAIGVSSGCADRAVTALKPAAETAALLRARSSAVSSTVSITAISFESRYWDLSALSPQTGRAAEAKFAALPTNVVGYSNAPVAVYSLDHLTNASVVPSGANGNLATRYQVNLAVSAVTTVAIRFGPDYGSGGAMLVDGNELDAKWFDFWSGLNWLDANKILQGSVKLTKGNHVISVVGFENCCDGGVIAEIDGGAGWQPIAITAPPPPTYNGVTSVQAVTMETRYWDGASFTMSGAGATAAFEALPTNVAGYTNAPLRVAALVNNRTLVANGASTDLGVRYRFVVNTVGDQAKVSFKIAPDFSEGGVLLLDGVEVASNWSDLCCGMASTYPVEFIVADSVVLQPGTHVFEVVGFEHCCDALAGAAFDFGTGQGWQDLNGIVPSVPNFTLTVNRTGSGAVTSSPIGISCGSACTYGFDVETPVSLTAVPDPGFVFAGWSGACSGTGACNLTIAGAATVSAVFTRPLTALTIAPTGSGSGRVTSSPVGIDCGATCAASFPEGTSVTLTAVAAVGSAFDGWGTACTGTGPCTVTVNAAATVAPVFTRLPDSTPPALSCAATPSLLWPVNHKLWDVQVRVTANDAVSGPVGFTLVSVTSNEAPNRNGDGTTSVDMADWTLNTADVAGQLRAERAGDLADRVYTLTYKASDAAGNVATASCAVTVPHDQR